MGTPSRSLAVKLAAIALAAAPLLGVTNIDPTLKYGWGENIGWLNWADANSGADGVVVHPGFLSGYIWAENVGYINVGNGGGPYLNSSGADYGANYAVASGNLSGYGWGENIGWTTFNTAPQLGLFGQQARFDPATGRFHGYAWGENVGWINLEDAVVRALLPPAPTIVSAMSRKFHAAAATSFDVNALTANGVEGRTFGPTQLRVTFDQNIDGFAGLDATDVSLTSGSVTGIGKSAALLTVNLSGVTDQLPFTILFPGIVNAFGTPSAAKICLRALIGDANGDGNTNIFDLVVMRNVLNTVANATTFRTDVNADGNINVFDLVTCRNNLNKSVAPCP